MNKYTFIVWSWYLLHKAACTMFLSTVSWKSPKSKLLLKLLLRWTKLSFADMDRVRLSKLSAKLFLLRLDLLKPSSFLCPCDQFVTAHEWRLAVEADSISGWACLDISAMALIWSSKSTLASKSILNRLISFGSSKEDRRLNCAMFFQLLDKPF